MFLLIAAVLSAASLAAAAPVSGQASIRASIGFSGWVVPARWLPLTVDLDGGLPGAVLEIRRSREAGGPPAVDRFTVGLAGHLEVPVFVDENARRMELRLLSGTTLLARRELAPLDRVFAGHVILAVGLSVAEQATLGRILFPREPVQVVGLSLAELPSSLLSLDAVSALVLRSPGHDPNPAQLAALRPWLAAGGRLVVLDAVSEGWQASLGAREAPIQSMAGGVVHDLGLGRLVELPPGPGDAVVRLDVFGWREILELPIFDRFSRLTASTVFPRSLEAIPSSLAVPPSRRLPWMPVLVWLGLMGAACLVRKHALPAMAAVSLLGLVAVFVFLAGPETAWQKGVSVQGRVLVFPGQAGSLVSAQVWFPGADNERRSVPEHSPWGVAVSWQSGSRKVAETAEGGRLLPHADDPAPWSHATARGDLLLRSASASGWQFNGFVPPSNNSSLPGEGRLLALFRCAQDGANLRISQRDPANGRWFRLENPPAAYRAELAWAGHLSRLASGRDWQISIIAQPSFGLMVEGEGARVVCQASLPDQGGE